MESVDELYNISPIDGRYAKQTRFISNYFSEAAFFTYRVWIELKYLNAFCLEIFNVDPDFKHLITQDDIIRIKQYEQETKHDVKAIEYFLKNHIIKDPKYHNFIHFGLTSQDINNPAITLLLSEFIDNEYYPILIDLTSKIESMGESWKGIKMLGHTHGQPATPTTLGKEFLVFSSRLREQYKLLKQVPRTTKFGGAVGTLSAHKIAIPDKDWEAFADTFIEKLGNDITRQAYTTQIENYDNLCAILDGFRRINVILLNLCTDIWLYTSKNYLKLRSVETEVGSSTMPHKVNPINFENAEGNLKVANSLFNLMSNELPRSRLQRDLTDSTILRNLGVPIAHTSVGINSIIEGLTKISPNEEKIKRDLEQNPAVMSEAIQTILRLTDIEDPYEVIKKLTRGMNYTKEDLEKFLETLAIDNTIKEKISNLTVYDL